MRLKRPILLIILLLVLFSCNNDDGGYTQVKAIENLIYVTIKEYREDSGQTGPFVHQYLMVKEAQLYSTKMALGIEPYGTQGLDEHWNTLTEKFNFYNLNALVLKTETNDEDLILSELLLIPGADSILQSDVTQCGVGVENDTDGFNYVTIMLAKADS
jgi:hypothetical protein